MRSIFLAAVICVASLCGTGTAFSRPHLHTVHKRHHVHHVRHAKRHHHVRVAHQRYAAECGVTMPCEGIQPAYERHIERRRPTRVYEARRAPSSFGAPSFSMGYSGSRLVEIARSQIGNGPRYGRRTLWCARFMNYVVERAGYRGTGSDMAASFARYGHRVSGPQIGAIAVMSRGRRGGHVGVVSGVTAEGDPIIISGNHGHRVAEGVYPRGRIYAYVVPAS